MVTTVRPIEFRSDNAAGIAPEILSAIAAANSSSAAAYGHDEWTAQLHEQVAEVFEHPNVSVFPVTTGTAANALALSALCPPWGSVLCHETAHVVRSECGATSMFSGGAVMQGIPGDQYKLDVAGMQQAFATTRWGDPHNSQPSVLSLTSPTDFGTIYSPDEVSDLSALARSRGLRVHLDGSRIANALAALGCSPADLTWRVGVDVLTLGATKNGAATTDAIVCFDPAIAEQLVYRVKRAGHVASKMRFQSAQLSAYLADGLWLRLATAANAALQQLAAGLVAMGIELSAEPSVNMLFFRVDDDVSARMHDAGLLFKVVGERTIRLVTSFQTTQADVSEALRRIAAAL